MHQHLFFLFSTPTHCSAALPLIVIGSALSPREGRCGLVDSIQCWTLDSLVWLDIPFSLNTSACFVHPVHLQIALVPSIYMPLFEVFRQSKWKAIVEWKHRVSWFLVASSMCLVRNYTRVNPAAVGGGDGEGRSRARTRHLRHRARARDRGRV